MDQLDRSVQEFVRIAKEHHTLPLKSNVILNHRGDSALGHYIRISKIKNEKTLSHFIKTVRYFLQNRYSLYHSNLRGTYPFLSLISKVPIGKNDLDTKYKKFLRALLTEYPPPPYDHYRPILQKHPIKILFDRIARIYDTGKDSIETLRPLSSAIHLVLSSFDDQYIDHDDFMRHVLKSIQKQYHMFFDSVIKFKDLFTKDDVMRILNIFMLDRSVYEPEDIDDQDDQVLKKVLNMVAEWEDDDGFLYFLSRGKDVRSIRIIFPLMKSAMRKSFFFEDYLRHINRCEDADLDVLQFMLASKVLIRDSTCLHDIIRNDCIEIIRLLYEYGALKRQILQELHNDLFDILPDTNESSRLIHDILQRGITMNQASTMKQSKKKTLMNSLAPDVLRTLSTYIS